MDNFFSPEFFRVLPYAILTLVSLIAIITTFYDKQAAKKENKRISEKTLLKIAIFGGAIAMYFTMLSIRHKTKHGKFMIGLPIITLLQILLVLYVYLCNKI